MIIFLWMFAILDMSTLWKLEYISSDSSLELYKLLLNVKPVSWGIGLDWLFCSWCCSTIVFCLSFVIGLLSSCWDIIWGIRSFDALSVIELSLLEDLGLGCFVCFSLCFSFLVLSFVFRFFIDKFSLLDLSNDL